jgi:hypothetical protein
MEIIERDELRDEYPDIVKGIQSRHEMHPDVPIELFKRHKPVKGLAHTRSYFIILSSTGRPDSYIQYYMRYQVVDPKLNLIGRAVDKVIIYETYQEFEADRVRLLSNSKNSEGINLN